MKNFVITIARGFGSGGKDIGNKLAKEFGIQCYERRILTMASEHSGINERLFYAVDEKLRGNYITNVLKGLPIASVPLPVEKKFVSDISLFHIQAQIIKELAKNESCIIVGKCANKILEDLDNVVSVYIEAPRNACLASIMDKLQVPEREANRMIEKTDKYRADYYKYYSGGDYWTNPTSYDLTLNSDRVGRDNCVKLIKDYLNIKLGIKPE